MPHARIKELELQLLVANESLAKLSASKTEPAHDTDIPVIATGGLGDIKLNEAVGDDARPENSQRVAGLGDWEYDFVRDRLLWSDDIYRILGISRKDFPPNAETFYRHVHPDDLAFVQQEKKSAAEGLRRGNFEHRIIRPDGKIRHIYQIAEMLFDDQGRPLREVGTLQDITERKLAEEALRKSESGLAAAQRVARLGSWEMDLIDPDDPGRCPTRWSDELFRLFGYEPRQFEPSSARVLEMVHPEDRPRVAQALTELVHDAKSFDLCYRIIHGDGTEHMVHERTEFVIGAHCHCVIGTVQDVTLRARAEEARRQSEERFVKMFRSSPIAVAYGETGHKAGFIDVNDRWVEFFGYSRETMIGRTARDLGLWVDPAERELLLTRLAADGVVTNFECRFRQKSGAIRVALLSVELLHFGPQAVRLSMLVDITERKQSEEALRMQSRVLESMIEGVNVVNEEGIILFSNAACDAMFGYPRGSLVGRPASVLDDLSAEESRLFAERTREQLGREASWSGEIANRKRDGTPFVTRVQLSRAEIAGRKCTVAVREDITQTKQLESQLLRVQRVESVSRLASGIAHDMNNILAPIMMAVPLLRARELSVEMTDKLFNAIETGASRGAQLVKQLLFFGRGIEGQRTMLRLKDSVQEIEDMISETFPRRIAISTRVSGETSPIHADSTQIHQVLLNLCVNARDAMPLGGELSITVMNVKVDQELADRSPAAQPGLYVLVTVGDTGTGISPENREKIFDPFFTTKEVGKGTGLGLSTVVAIVKGHGGFMTLDSEMGRGTRFHVYLPVVAAAAVSPAQGSVTLPPKGHNETVLVVDDEEPIRRMTEELLTRSGYRVLTASDGAQALVLFSQQGDEIKLVVTDYDMPGMDGLAMIRVLKNIEPAIKIILATGVQSGLHTDERTSELESLGVTTILAKPFTAQILLAAIHGLIGAGVKVSRR